MSVIKFLEDRIATLNADELIERNNRELAAYASSRRAHQEELDTLYSTVEQVKDPDLAVDYHKYTDGLIDLLQATCDHVDKEVAELQGRQLDLYDMAIKLISELVYQHDCHGNTYLADVWTSRLADYKQERADFTAKLIPEYHKENNA